MNTIYRYISLLAAGLAPLAVPAASINLTDVDGNVLRGNIIEVFQERISLESSSGSVEFNLSQLSPESRQAVDDWAQDNAHAVDVYTSYDTSPVPVRTNNPRQFLDKGDMNEEGMVAVSIVISEEGEVIWAEVQKTTNQRLNRATLKAVKQWKFKPAVVGGEQVRSRVRIPVSFKYN